MKTVFLFDNKDSFTYNLVHYLEGSGAAVIVCRNDEPLSNWPKHADALVLSPGPGLPHESGSLMKVIDRYWGKIPILGVCLGHQSLVEYTGGNLYNMEQVDHGISKRINLDNNDHLFYGLNQQIQVGLYHSWAVDRDSLGPHWNIIADSKDVVMGLRHKSEQVWGVQFHPESVMTPEGKKMIANFINFISKK